jgi:leucyl/phenylalanyl-tRNA--protein transferase
VIAWLRPGAAFPPPERALATPNGLLAASRDVTPERVIDAYRHGIFPWYSEGQPVLWWSPDPRMVLYPAEFHLSRSLARRIRRAEFDVRIDTAFDAVIGACAATPREGDGPAGTWITPAMQDAYRALHRLGYAHSVEAWQGGELVGGLYGLALGQVFFGESMFARVTDASKVALAALVGTARRGDIALIDCQQETRHLASLGARPIPRARFARALVQLIHSNEAPRGWIPGTLPEHA